MTLIGDRRPAALTAKRGARNAEPRENIISERKRAARENCGNAAGSSGERGREAEMVAGKVMGVAVSRSKKGVGGWGPRKTPARFGACRPAGEIEPRGRRGAQVCSS